MEGKREEKNKIEGKREEGREDVSTVAQYVVVLALVFSFSSLFPLPFVSGVRGRQ
jgi:hypothetical protein